MARRISGGMVAAVGLVGVLSCCCCGGGAMLSGGMFLQSRVAELAAVCNGQPAPSAAAYVPGTSGPHPVTIMERHGGAWSAQFGRVRSEWASDTTPTTELVVCLEAETERVAERCEYEGGRVVSRVQFDQRVRVLVAQTAQPLIDSALTGGEATVCPEILVGDGMTFRYEGPHVGENAATLEALLQPVVAP